MTPSLLSPSRRNHDQQLHPSLLLHRPYETSSVKELDPCSKPSALSNAPSPEFPSPRSRARGRVTSAAAGRRPARLGLRRAAGVAPSCPRPPRSTSPLPRATSARSLPLPTMWRCAMCCRWRWCRTPPARPASCLTPGPAWRSGCCASSSGSEGRRLLPSGPAPFCASTKTRN